MKLCLEQLAQFEREGYLFFLDCSHRKKRERSTVLCSVDLRWKDGVPATALQISMEEIAPERQAA